jgi:cytochrome c5
MRVCPVVLSVVFLAFATGCAKQEPPKPTAPAAPMAAPFPDGKTLFEAKCSVCHGLDRPMALKETKEKWASIVQEMRAKKVDWISDAEASKIVDYLAEKYGKK